MTCIHCKGMDVIYDVGEDHRIGRAPDGLIYIWDRSGDTPFETDDGPMQPAGPVYISSDNWTTRLTIEVVDHNDRRRVISISAPVAEYLHRELHFALQFKQHRFTCNCGHTVQTTPPDAYGIDCPVCDLGVEEAFLTGAITADVVRDFGLDPDEINKETTDA